MQGPGRSDRHRLSTRTTIALRKADERCPTRNGSPRYHQVSDYCCAYMSLAKSTLSCGFSLSTMCSPLTLQALDRSPYRALSPHTLRAVFVTMCLFP